MDHEMVDVVDESGRVVDTMSRAETEKLNHPIQNVIVAIFNSRGEVWVQKRATAKKYFPGLWDISACGAVANGEEPEAAAMRETLEETGITANLSYSESFLNVFPGPDDQTVQRFSHLYVAVSDEIPRINEEVDEFRVAQYEKLLEEAAKNPEQYVPSFLVELQKAVAALNKLK